jgi:predicted AAA+ superfamily ATPase
MYPRNAIKHLQKLFASFPVVVVSGARQVGKTYAVRQLGTEFESFVEVNFEQLPHLRTIFAKDLDPRRIIIELSVLTQKPIVPGKTLLFFDEIQRDAKGTCKCTFLMNGIEVT